MKKIIGVVLGITVCLFFFVSLSLAYDLIATDPPYDCGYTTYTNCQQCHVTMANGLYNYKYGIKPTWHWQHKTLASSANGYSGCATCHTGAAESCGTNLVETKNCKICHNLTPPTLPNPNLTPPTVTPAAESLPCNWVYNHDIAHPERGTNCRSCHCYTVQPYCCDLVELSSFTATPANRKVILTWKTESEIDNAGFNVYRAKSEDGEYIKINGALIPAEGTSTKGTVYHYVDGDLVNGEPCYYKLEDIDTSGFSSMHGPVSATPKGIKR